LASGAWSIVSVPTSAVDRLRADYARSIVSARETPSIASTREMPPQDG
jgi:hypothetical protein